MSGNELLFLPLSLRVDQLRILFVGGGAEALHKIRPVHQFAPGNIAILWPHIDDELHRLGCRELLKEYEATDLEGFGLIYACSGDEGMNARIASDARRYGILVNVADRRGLSDFISPAIFRQGGITVAVSSNGLFPATSVAVRNHLAAQLQQGGVLPKAPAEPVGHGFAAIAAVDCFEADAGSVSGFRHGEDGEESLPDSGAVPELCGGMVSLIGAGPGDPDLLTLRADRILRMADVILHDDLVSPGLLDRYDAQKILTGKRKDGCRMEQSEIHAEILRHVGAGRRVIRLKGGDPFIFGRGGEEVMMLHRHGIPYEVVPGITAAQGAAAAAAIPLTFRQVASSVSFCTAHPRERLTVPDTDTVVYYMAATALPDILQALAERGRPTTTPVALVENATLAEERVVHGTLGEWLMELPAIHSPALLVVGEVLRFARSWHSLVSGADPESA